MRILLDANILFPASNPKWLAGPMLEALARHREWSASEFAIEEARRNVAGAFRAKADGPGARPYRCPAL
ncbi:MAG: hypothetical protein ACOYNG_02265 [Terrimicrobiaceae bacterium]